MNSLQVQVFCCFYVSSPCMFSYFMESVVNTTTLLAIRENVFLRLFSQWSSIYHLVVVQIFVVGKFM